MSSNAIALTPTSLPEGICFANEQSRLNAYTAAIAASYGGSAGFNVGNSTPSVDSQGLPWARTNVDGSLDRIYTFFGGQWRAPHYTPPGSIMLYMGTLADLDTFDGGSAGTVTLYAGPFWAEVTEARFRAPMGPGTSPDGTVLAVGGTTGTEKVTLVKDNIPAHQHDFPDSITGLFRGWNAGSSNHGNSWKSPDYIGTETNTVKENVTTTAKFSVLSPVIGTYLIRRTARQFYVI